MKITFGSLKSFVPRAPDHVLHALVDQAPRVLHHYGINTPLRMAHFFAQLAHESGGFTIREENLNYSAQRMTQVWPSRFPTVASATPYAKNPQALANNVYASRMGNGPPSSGDGYKYRGRGLAQHTGKDGYAQIARITGLPLVEKPELVNDPQHMLECAAAFWQWKNLAPLADANDLSGVTRKWNGGLTGLADRRIWLGKANSIFKSPLDREGGTLPAPKAVIPTPAPMSKVAAPAPAGPRDPMKDTAVIIAAGAAGGVAAGVNAGVNTGWGLMEWGIAVAVVVGIGVAGYFVLRWWQGRKGAPQEVQEGPELVPAYSPVQDAPLARLGLMSADPADRIANEIAFDAVTRAQGLALVSEALATVQPRELATRPRTAKAKSKASKPATKKRKRA